MKIRNFLFVILLFVTNSAFAGFLIEPYLGYSLNGKGDVSALSTNYSSEYSSLTYGGRIGYSYLGLMAGIDYSLQNPELESSASGTTYKDEIKKNQLGLFVGYKFPIMLRAWATYFLNAEFKGTQSSGTHFIENIDKFEDGSGYALGVGYTGLPFLSINLEYRAIEYDKWKSDGADVTSVTEKMNLNEILLSLSVPLNI